MVVRYHGVCNNKNHTLSLFPKSSACTENSQRWLYFSPETLATTIGKLIDKKLLHEWFAYANVLLHYTKTPDCKEQLSFFLSLINDQNPPYFCLVSLP
jgi:hypothetical protein